MGKKLNNGLMGHRLGSVALGNSPLTTVDEPDGWMATDRSFTLYLPHTDFPALLVTFSGALFGGMPAVRWSLFTEMNMKAKANVFAVSMTVLMFGVFGLLMMQLG